MKHNNWNVMFQLFTAMKGYVVDKRVLTFKGPLPELSQATSHTQMHAHISGRLDDWIASYDTAPIYTHKFEGAAVPSGIHDTAALGHIGEDHAAYWDVDWDNPEHVLRIYLGLGATFAHNEALSPELPHEPTWFVIADKSDGQLQGVSLTAAGVRFVGSLSTPSAPDPSALLQLVVPSQAGKVARGRDFTKLTIPI
ncbi:hypothetical protein [Pseudoalteromonas umbrosa]|uniref:hypothetical protein n=1 Tax=Pseudoalteromonas umbrosa TaxID=3048489 RepID=UPI0024C2861C|nr:hypothetical protein [Pseudoalteromonas sp. B95]MDK1290077.1 hypothetical protein [Pseudoalteromonas sp. B95]